MTQIKKFAQRTGVRRFVYRYSVLLAVLVFGATLLTSILVHAADADLDPSFDGDGVVTTDRAEFDRMNDIVIQPDGKIVAVGNSGNLPLLPVLGTPTLDVMVARYNSNGSLDPSFGTGGVVTTDLGGPTDNAFSVALQADGKILISGRTDLNNQAPVAVLRYNINGSLDTTFGNGGIVVTSLGAFSSGDLAIQPDGKIVVSGTSVVSGAPVFSVARYQTNGSLDQTFDGDGMAQAPSAGQEAPWGLALQADGKIVVAGESVGDQTDDFCLARFNSDGSVDGTFNGNGLVLTSFEGGFSRALDVAIQADGKIVAAGTGSDTAGPIVALARYNSDGSLDSSFDGDGRVNGIPGVTNALAFRPDGKIVVAGSGNQAMLVARYNSDGSLDETFGSSGAVTTSIGTEAVATAVALQTDGRIVAGGYGNSTIDFGALHVLSDWALVRYGTAGAANQPPNVTITGPVSGSLFAVNTPVSFSGTFTDDSGDTHTANWTFESITQPGIVVEPSNSTPGLVTTTYTFSQAGVYRVALTVTDNGNLSGTATTVNGLPAMVVIFDPSAAWVSGGGWFNSPAGAFIPINRATGQAIFGFVSRYQNGKSVPDGTTGFQFLNGNLHFQSTSYEWLVVSGGKKAQYKGTGTINGSGNFRFMVTVVDGDQPGGDGFDRFRIRIWSDSNGLIYDNETNFPDGDVPTSVLGGGNIVIHQ